MSKNYAIIIHFMLPLTTFYRSGAHRSDVYKWDAFVTSWRFYNRAWQPQRHDRLAETSGTLWIHRGALTNQRCSLATGCGITRRMHGGNGLKFCTLMYLDHFQNWLVYGYGLVIFLILALFGLSETGQIWGFRVFPRERMEEMAWNFARWCILTTFRTD